MLGEVRRRVRCTTRGRAPGGRLEGRGDVFVRLLGGVREMPSPLVRKFLGRRMESTVRFDEYEPPRKFAIESTSGPVQFHVHQTYEPEGAGARINIVMEGEPGGFFKLAEPLVERAIRREMEANFATLKDILEARSSY
jgi:carbon monoxide dehydrogenase subunit G